MAKALCLSCGEIKEGGLSACPACAATATGDMNLDIAFTEQCLTPATLVAFGDVVRAINRVCDQERLRFWSFARYVSKYHPELLGVEMPPDKAKECDAILAKANPPAVVVEESGAAGMLGEPEVELGE